MTVILPNLAISGYRSFGATRQHFDSFTKINILIGRNNSGKSNVLRVIKEVLPQVGGPRGPFVSPDPLKLEPIAVHLPDQPPFQLGIGEAAGINTDGRWSLPTDSERHKSLPELQVHRQGIDKRDNIESLIAELLCRKAEYDKTNLAWSFTTFPARKPFDDTWVSAMQTMGDQQLRNLFAFLTPKSGGSRQTNWEPEIVANFALKFNQEYHVELIPAIRRIGASGTDPLGYDGTGIINRLAQLQNPSAEKQSEKLTFEAINEFLREVTDRPEARIEIPYARDTILVHMDGKVLPIDCLGSGLHEVIILAAAATTLNNQIVCIEEPELHLNPILQKKFIRHLIKRTENQYFITTHSAAIMDTPEAEVYHVTLVDCQSRVARVTCDSSRAAICEDLGYQPSDLLLANCIIWVEGPSDRLYLNWWLRTVDSSLVEGIHFSVMFYGGKLLAHLTNAEPEEAVTEFINLRRLNHRGVILIDSDRKNHNDTINCTKTRLRDEFNEGPGYAWITYGREIENYLPIDSVSDAVTNTKRSAKRCDKRGPFHNLLELSPHTAPDSNVSPRKKEQANKVEVAKWITNNTAPDLTLLDLQQQLTKLVDFIKKSNPGVNTL